MSNNARPSSSYKSLPAVRRRSKMRTLLARDGDRCWVCGVQFSEEIPATFDHVVPQSRGGSWKNENLRLACHPCNNHRHPNKAVAPHPAWKGSSS